jgi:hypothetical protein
MKSLVVLNTIWLTICNTSDRGVPSVTKTDYFLKLTLLNMHFSVQCKGVKKQNEASYICPTAADASSQKGG